MTEDSGAALTAPAGIPAGAFLELPKPTVDGEVIPPIPVTFAVGATPKDALGHRWIILRAFDGTVTAEFRLPWQLAPGIGQAIMNGLSQVAQQIDAEETAGLIVPGRAPGGAHQLLIPGPPNGARHG